MVNYYVELGLDRGLDAESLKQELAKLRRKWQTRANAAATLEDQHKAENMMSLIREASAVLLVKEEREKYDRKLDKDPELSQQSAATSGTDVAPTSNFLDEAAALDALEVAYNNSRNNSVVAIANQLITMGTHHERVYTLLALTYLEMNQVSKAESTIQDMISKLPDDPDAHYQAAFFDLRILEKTKEARAHIDWLLQSDEGASARVAALDVEYYIDTHDFALAEAKTEQYRQTVGRDGIFTKQVSDAYRQHSETYCAEYGGDTYFETKENYESWKKYQQLALKVYPDAKAQSIFADNMKIVDGITFMKSNFPGILFGLLLGAIYVGSGPTSAIGAIFLLLSVFITVFSFVPKWMAHKASYTGSLDGPYLIAQWASKIIGIVFNALVWITKTIFRLIWSFF